ncbi:hypothetical protein Tco_0992706 [Tanacetum coccineum]|uniref:Uncharacterized protein n=1 Tax=Tanacetum coccineum TaxID=301880 RepID=A0ABQ5F4C0_9ASTR
MKSLEREIIEVKAKFVFPSSKFDGTPREVLSSRGNVKISSEKSIRTSSQKPHPRRILHIEPWDKALLTGGDSLTLLSSKPFASMVSLRIPKATQGVGKLGFGFNKDLSRKHN